MANELQLDKLGAADILNFAPQQPQAQVQAPVQPPITAPGTAASKPMQALTAGDILGRPLEGSRITVAPHRAGDDFVPSSELSALGLFARGTRAGGRNIRTDFDRLRALVADSAGGPEHAQRILENADLFQQETQRRFGGDVPFDEAFNDTRNFARWLSYLGGEQAPMLAATLTGGGIGATLGRAVAKGAISQGTANAAARFAINRGAVRGGMAGGAITEGGVATGSAVGEQIAATGEINAPAALISGAAQGMLGAITPIAVGRLTGVISRDSVTRLAKLAEKEVEQIAGRAGRAGAQFLRLGVMEGATEVMQEAVAIAARKFVDEEYDILGPEAQSRLLEALAGGFFVGGGVGGIVGALQRGALPGEDTPAKVTAEDLPGTPPPPPLLLPPPTDVTQEEVAPGDTGALIEEAPTVIITPPPTPTALPPEEVFTEHVPTIAIRDEQELGAPNLEFVSGVEAKRRRAELGEPTGDIFRSFAISDQASPELFTSGLRGLPNTVAEFEALLADPNSGISFLDEQARSTAERTVKEAIGLRNTALLNVLHGKEGAPTQLKRAQTKLRLAVKNGFRFRPADMLDRDVMAVDTLPPGSLVEVAAQEGTVSGFVDTSNVTIPDFVTAVPSGSGFIPLGNETAQVLLGPATTKYIGKRIEQQKGDKKARIAVEFDLRRVPPELQFVASVKGMRAALGAASNARKRLRDLKDAGFAQFPEQNFEDIVIASGELASPFKRLNDEAAVKLIKLGLRIRPTAVPNMPPGHIAIEAPGAQIERITNAIHEVPLLPGEGPTFIQLQSEAVVLDFAGTMLGENTREGMVLENKRRAQDVADVIANIEPGQIRTIVRAPDTIPSQALRIPGDRDVVSFLQGALKALKNLLRLKNHSFVLVINTGFPPDRTKGRYIGTTDNVHVILINLRNLEAPKSLQNYQIQE